MSLKISYIHSQKLTQDSDLQRQYESYKNNILSNLGNPSELSNILEDYLTYAKKVEKSSNDVTVRSAYYSSILEEHPVLVFEDKIKTLTANIQGDFFLGNCECVIFSGATVDCKPRFDTKKIDFAFAYKTDKFPYPVLLAGYEVKKYLDKTMYDSVVQTHEVLREFRPATFYGFLGEDEARGKEVILNSKMKNKEFILTNQPRNRDERNKIDSDVYSKWYEFTINEIKESLRHL